MKNEAENKLNLIADIWKSYILEYQFCQKKIKYTEETKTNYFGDILGYFIDTFPIIYERKHLKSFSHSETFSHHISLLQSIYVHQDFVEELLVIFKCNISKGDLKLDPNYSINRNLRNELIGHPIRRNNGKLISSCLFGYGTNLSKILYLKYHQDKNYKFEKKECEVSEIISRHNTFLNTYFDKILDKLKAILSLYYKQLENFDKIIDKTDFSEIVRISSIYFESILKYDYVYDIKSLMIIYEKRNNHRRYQNLISTFLYDLKSNIFETQQTINDIINPKKKLAINDSIIPTVQFEIVYTDEISENPETKPKKVSYYYELGKLATKRNLIDFEFFSSFLHEKCAENKTVISELENMKNNIFDEIEYYSSFRLICKELNQE